MYENSTENELYAASTTCRPGAGDLGGDSAIVPVMFGALEAVANEARATRRMMLDMLINGNAYAPDKI